MRRHRQISKKDYYRGVQMLPYDLIKELAVATGVMLVVILVLAGALSSPDAPSVTIQSWAKAAPLDYVTTATAELAGTAESATYGPPYNQHHQSDDVQSIGPFAPQLWFGIHVPINSATDYVLQPLSESSPGDPQLAAALTEYRSASRAQQQSWLNAYTSALGKATVAGDTVTVAAGHYGPLPTMMDTMLELGRSGAMDGLLLSGHHFYQTDYSLPLMFMASGSYLAGLAHQNKMEGNQWGMMNESGSYPGQAWLWLYTFWYQIPPFLTATYADLLVVIIMGVLSIALLLLPLIPGLRDIPRLVPVHRLVWRNYYQEIERAAAARGGAAPAASSS